MSGEQRFRYELIGIFLLIVICLIIMIAGGASAEEGEGWDVEYQGLLLDLNENQNANGSWDNDLDITVVGTYANVVDQGACFSRSLKIYCDSPAFSGMNWTVYNYYDNVSVETQSFLFKTSNSPYIINKCAEWDTFGITVGNDLKEAQLYDGSWNNNIGDTAMATWALADAYDENSGAIKISIDWIRGRECEYTWGSIEDDSKAILALGGAGLNVRENIEVLMSKQRPDGSFGDIEDSSWAVMALSIHPNSETMESMEKTMELLRSQDYENNEDLAMAALAEQYYENAKLKEDEQGAGSIPPPLLYAISILVVGSLTMSYWLFARLDRNEVLDGVRKDLYAYIAEHPGEHLASITKRFDLSSSSARYHLSVLEGMDRIVSHKNGKYKRYYVNKNGYSRYTNGNGYKHIMSALKNGTARRIVKFLLSNPESNQKRVSNALKINPSTVNWHAKRLNDAEILSKHKKGKEIVYSLNQDVQLRKVIGLLEGSIA